MKKIIIVALLCIVFSTVSAMAAEVDCIVDQVANMGNRVHVHCQTPTFSSGIKPSPFPFFALPLDSPSVDTFTSMAQAVQRENREQHLLMFCAPHSEGGLVGCEIGGGANGYIQSSGWPFTLHIWYDEKDTGGTSFNCEANNCRMPQGFGILK
jgi:hypothetical protein